MTKEFGLKRNKVLMAGSAAILTAAMLLVPGAGIVKADEPVDATVTIKTTMMDGETIVDSQAVSVTAANPTVKDAIEAAETVTGVDVDIESTGWGYYVSAVEVDGHSASNMYYDNNGTDSSDSIAKTGTNPYYYKNNIDAISAPAFVDSDYGTQHFWTNTVATTNYLTEHDYNYNSGWMLEINDDNYANYGIDTALSDGDDIVLEFTMFGGADLGATAYVLGTTATSYSSGPWVAINPF